MLKLSAPQKTTAQLIAIGASGAKGLAPKAKADLQERLHAQIRAEMRAEMAKRQGAR